MKEFLERYIGEQVDLVTRGLKDRDQAKSDIAYIVKLQSNATAFEVISAELGKLSKEMGL